LINAAQERNLSLPIVSGTDLPLVSAAYFPDPGHLCL
jgi:hypothetical protein